MIRRASAPPIASDEDVARAAVKADRERVSQILESPEAALAPLLAAELALNSDESTASALSILRIAVEPLKRKRAASSAAQPTMSLEEIESGWAEAVAQVNSQRPTVYHGSAVPPPRGTDPTTKSATASNEIEDDWAAAARAAGVPLK